MDKIMPFMKLRYYILRNSIRTLKKQSLLKICFVSLCFALFLTGEFLICLKAFSFIRGFPGIGPILVERLMYLFYFVLFIMLIFSNAIVAYAVMYRSKDTELLFSYPISSSIIFKDKFIESTMLSSWAFLILLIPFMISYGISNNAFPGLYLGLPLFFISFLIINGSLGGMISMFLVRLLEKRGIKMAIWLIPFSGFIYFIYRIIYAVRLQERVENFDIFLLNQMLPNVRLSHFPFLPSYWMSEAILKIARRDIKNAIFYFLVLLSSSLFSIEILSYLGQRYYRETWLGRHFSGHRKNFLFSGDILERFKILFGFLDRGTRGLIIKDIKLFWREPLEWSQFVIFFGILGAYFLNLKNFSYNLLESFWKNLCAFLNLSAVLLTLGSLTTRFIFPQMSLEGARFWFIGLSQIGLKKVFYVKFWLNGIICLIITETLLILSNRMLEVSGLVAGSFMWVGGITSFVLVALSTGFGAAFPDFKSEHPTKIVSGFGGTLTLITSIIFIIIVLACTTFPFHLFLKGIISQPAGLKEAVFISMGLISVAGIGGCVISLLYGINRLNSAEF